MNMYSVMLSAQSAAAAGVIDANQPIKNVGEALGYSLSTSLFGFAVVFGVLALIWGVLSLFKIFFAGKSEENKKKPEITESAVQNVSPAVDEAALVAAITAAVSAYRVAHGESAGGFRVVSFKKRK